ncbi:hypothetical protein SVIO_011600 [Streptomyces violaceusniger]|uniref:Uncharacterized protein n=1 Tax=Streptomyces violaceusniger TaxID=68280 RepID=A0A4D4KVJ7_STRVO|nr:hypothetical protein SVIO_011600 [Streptomyces violaceusniger]
MLTPDLPPVVDVPDLTFPPQGRHSDESKRAAERNGDKETPTSAPTPPRSSAAWRRDGRPPARDRSPRVAAPTAGAAGMISRTPRVVHRHGETQGESSHTRRGDGHHAVAG